MKTKQQQPITLPDDSNTLSVQFYISDSGAPRVLFHFPNGVNFDHAISEYSSLTAAQKTNLRNMLLALRDETFTLEGYT